MQLQEWSNVVKQIITDLCFVKTWTNLTNSGTLLNDSTMLRRKQLLPKNPSLLTEIATTTDNSKIANSYCRFFTKIGSSLQSSAMSITGKIWKHRDHITLRHKVNLDNHTFKFRKVSVGEIIKSVKKLHPSKAYGPDQIPPSFVKDGINEICKPLEYLINMSLTTSTFPSVEKSARVKPIYKSDKRSMMNNYRPISILPVFSKVIESLVHQQLYEYLEKNRLLSKFQFGFRKNRNTQQAVTLLTDHIRLHMDKDQRTGAVFLDLSKAFDTVDHAWIISKLASYGICKTEQKWFESYLFNRKQYVEYEFRPNLVLLPLECHKARYWVRYWS